MKGELEGRVALVLGAGSLGEGIGIGKAICLAFAEAGASIVAADRNLKAAEETARVCREAGGRAEAAMVDVTDDSALGDLVSGTAERHGRIDVLYCNVGLGKAGSSDQTSPAEWRQIADANLTALHVASQAVVPVMKAQGGGVVLTTSSIAGIRHVGYPHLAYGVTKAAAIHFMRLFAQEHAAHGIRANTIVAGLIDTPRIRQTLATSYGGRSFDEVRKVRDAQVPLGRMGTSADIAEAALFLASDRAAYITGSEIIVDGGLSATVRQSSI
ncbi:SDR family NAD(P)-dependent oxidoreductase [Aurantimonas coralicida]|uniref:SDR family NAD(P)-dependent oxidoreductase n=1 Tax=Aurantimonas coralicida TaxID=182270 RepID=UPI001E5B2612|nr:SDR family NAD(P)-dependent oxidoreductase [Aurantimonas coralicida]MCD1645548.1 SDR family oxidoreductase [Aurantimonas coralicida]